ncbi:MAG: hypothetical protein ACPL7D_10655 [Candidatus Sumerlaeaceae bacterium]
MRKGWIIGALVCAALAVAPPGRAQNQPELSDFERTYRMYKTATWIAAGAMILFLVGGFLIKRRQTKLSEGPLGLDDLSKLEKRGLLTPEEAKKVRDALVRQAMQRANRPRTPLKGEEALLLDDEVRRLEALAQAKRAQKEQASTAASAVADATEIPPELQVAVEKGLLSHEEAVAIARRAQTKPESSGGSSTPR